MKLVKLSEVCSFSRGLTYSKSDEVEYSSNIVLRANNIDLVSNSLNLEDLRYIKDSIQIKKEKIAKKNSLIICTASGSKSHVGKVALIDEDYGYAFGGFMGQLTASDKCHPKFLYYVLTSGLFKDFLMSLNDGTNINNLKFSDIENYQIPLPTLEKQREIVEKLDSAFAEIDLLEGNLGLSDEKANELQQSLLSASFAPVEAALDAGKPSANQGFAMKFLRLRDVCVFNPPKSEARNVVGSDDLVGFMPMQDLGIESISAEARSSKPLNEVIKAYTYFAEKDVLIAKITPCFENGKMGIARNLVNGVGFGSSEYFVLRPTGSIQSEYLYYFLRQEFVIENGRGIMTGAVGHRRVPREYLENLEILIPSLETQFEIVEKLDSAFSEIEALKAQIKMKKVFALALRQSLLSSAFTHEEDVA